MPGEIHVDEQYTVQAGLRWKRMRSASSAPMNEHTSEGEKSLFLGTGNDEAEPSCEARIKHCRNRVGSGVEGLEG